MFPEIKREDKYRLWDSKSRPNRAHRVPSPYNAIYLMTVAEKFTLQYLLQKLENFHLEHYEKKTIGSREDLKSLAAEITPAE